MPILDELNFIINSIPYSALILDSSKKKFSIVLVNNEMLRMMDCNQEIFYSRYEKNGIKLFSSTSAILVQEKLQEMLNNENSPKENNQFFKVQLESKCSQPIWCNCKIQFLKLSDEESKNRYILVTFANISEYVRKSHDLQEQTALISMTKANLIQQLEYERYLRQITKEMYDHVCEIDLTNNVVIAEETARQYLEHRGSTQEFKTYDQFFKLALKTIIHPEYRKKCSQIFSTESLKNSFAENRTICSIECRATDDKKNYYWLEITARLFQYPATNSIHCILYLKNIDKVKKQEILLLEKSQQDSLTQLYNKRTIESLICDEIAKKENKFALLIIDLDNFKKVNDSLGHVFGDKVICEFSDEMKQLAEKDDLIGRVGGDEFFFFIKNYGRIENLKKRIQKLSENLVKIYSGSIEKYPVSASIGVSLFPEHGDTYQELYEKADKALYYSKGHGKNTYTIYNNEISVSNTYFFKERDIEALVNSTSDGIGKYAYDEKISILNYNRKLLDLLGFEQNQTPDSYQIKTLDFIHPNDQLGFLKNLRNALKNKSIFTHTYRIISFSGNILHVKVKGMFTEEMYKEKYHVFYLLHTDVSDLAELNEQLELKQQRMNLVNEFTDDLIYEYTPYTKEISIAGIPFEKLINGLVSPRSKAISFIQPKDVLEKNLETLESILGRQTEMFSEEAKLIHCVKGEIPVIVYGKRLHSKDVKTDQIIGKIINIAEKERQKQELEMSKRMMATLNRVSSLLISSTLGTFDERFNKVLSIIGETLEADAIDIWKFDADDDNKGYAVMIYEWTQLFSSFKGSIFFAEQMSDEVMERVISRLQKNITFLYCKDVITDATAIDYLDKRGFSSICLVPIHIDGKLWGVFSIGNALTTIQFNELQTNFIKIYAQLIISSIEERIKR